MTTLVYNGETLEVSDGTRKVKVSVEQALSLTDDSDVQESIVYAWQHPNEQVTIPNISYARGLKPRHSEVLGVQQ